ncbi:diphthamide biosynthesis protein 3-like isoform X1 [Montipora capricornis]|uniref:diphthamide biosynthesis protein 3-like isoform X1 n=1 Tax=Montipora capricornis TaxID=246305 RepID=UPI0035F11A79
MAVFHDEVEIEDFEYDEETETYFYPCPCGDQFQITKVGTTYLLLEAKTSSYLIACVKTRNSIVSNYHVLQEELENGEDVAHCPSCSLIIRVIYDLEDFMVSEEVTNQTPVLEKA